MNLIEKFLHWKDNPNRAPITIRNIWFVIQSLFRRKTTIPKHIEEQVVYRIEKSNPICKETNMCICSCTWDELIYADKACEGKCYPEMMDKKTWIKFKNEQGTS